MKKKFLKEIGVLLMISGLLFLSACTKEEPLPGDASQHNGEIFDVSEGPSTSDERENWLLINSNSNDLTLRFCNREGNPVSGLYIDIMLVEELEPDEKRADVGPGIITEESEKAYRITDDNGDYLWNGYAPGNYRLLVATSPRPDREPGDKMAFYTLNLTELSGHYLVEMVWEEQP